MPSVVHIEGAKRPQVREVLARKGHLVGLSDARRFSELELEMWLLLELSCPPFWTYGNLTPSRCSYIYTHIPSLSLDLDSVDDCDMDTVGGQ